MDGTTNLPSAAVERLRDAMVKANVFGYYPDQADMAQMPVDVLTALDEASWRVVPAVDGLTDEQSVTFEAGYVAGQRAMASRLRLFLRGFEL